MTFEEKLERARSGSRAAYGAACLGSLDPLYSAALIALKNEKTAKTAVVTAIDDGFSGVSRIKDERHLRSWLAHEITKFAVDKLRENKSSGVSEAPVAIFAETEVLSDVERLIFGISAAFGYNPREISVLTGMSESSVSEKLDAAKKRLGSSYDKMIKAAGAVTAPDTLRDKYMVLDSAEDNKLEIKILYPGVPLNGAKPAPVQPEEIEPAQAEEPAPEPVHEQKEEPAPEQKEEPAPVHPEEIKPEQANEPVQEPEAPTANTIQLEIPDSDDEAVFSEESEDEEYPAEEGEFADDGDELIFEEEEPQRKPIPDELPLSAETFIAVVSAEKMKGSEFLRLIGNTRISNSAYREIEQNPRLTKKRLIELLDSSHLTENDYYKLLTAIKERREVLDAKEESRLNLERAGLYDGSQRGKYKRRRREKPKTELQMAIGIAREKPDGPLILGSGPMDDDNSDFQLLNSSGAFAHPDYYKDRNAVKKEPEEPDLRLAINADKDINAEEDPMSHKALHELFFERGGNAVDPFAAIAANETGEQVKPDRKDKQAEEWKKADERGSSEPTSGNVSDTVTIEFDTAKTTPLELNTKQFDAVVPDAQKQPAEEKQPAAQDEPYSPTVYDDDVYSVKDETPEVEIESITPVGDVSVTQIIKDFASGEDVLDNAAELAAGISPMKEETGDHAGPASEKPETVGFTPDVGALFDDEDEKEPGFTETSELPYFLPDIEDEDIDTDANIPEDAAEEKVAVGEEAPAPDVGDDEDDDFDKPSRRYKGSEYFIDDNEYYDGVNNGKIAACAVFAVLLTAGGIGMGFIPKAEALPADTVINNEITEASGTAENAVPPAVEDEFVSEPTLEKLSSYADMTDEGYEGASIGKPLGASGYLRVSDEPFPSDIVTDFVGGGAVYAGDTAFVYSRDSGNFRAVYLGESDDTENEASVGEDEDEDEKITAPNVPEEYLYAFTAIDGELYVVSANGDNTEETLISVYDEKLSKKDEYTLAGSYSGCGITDGKLVAATYFDPNTASDLKQKGSLTSEHPYYISGGELKEIPASDIYAIEGAKHNALHIFYCVGKDTALAVLGGSHGASDVKFSDDALSLVVSDGNVSYAVDISADLKINGATAYKGSAVSADAVGHGGMVGMYSDGEGYGVTAYKGGKLLTVPDVSIQSVAWSESGIAYVVAEQNGGGMMLYGFDMSKETPESAAISASDIYTDKLISAGDRLAGLRAEPTPDGERAGLRLSLYEYDGQLRETAYSIIELDKDTPRENLKYLSSPAEQNILSLASNEDGTLFAIPTVYFDGYSEVERVVLLEFNGTTFSQVVEYMTYDEKSSVLIPVIRGNKVCFITDTNVAIWDIEE